MGEPNTTVFSRLSLGDAMRLHTLVLLQISEVYPSWTLARKPRDPHHLGVHTVAGIWGALDAL